MIESRVPTRATHVLAGTLTLPKGTPRIVALLIGGAGASDREYHTADGNAAYRVFSDSLACVGVASFRFDEVGAGRSTGSYDKYATTRTLANDVHDIVDWLAHVRALRGSGVVVVGHSEGGLIAGIVASENKSVAGAVLLAAPALRGDAIIVYQSAYRIADGETPESVVDRERRRLARGPWHQYFLTLDPMPFYARVNQPVLVLQGTEDWPVTPVQADSITAAVQRNGNPSVVCRKFIGLGHSLSSNTAPYAFDPGALAMIVNWIHALPMGSPRTGGTARCE